jgi:hypothetical protein
MRRVFYCALAAGDYVLVDKVYFNGRTVTRKKKKEEIEEGVIVDPSLRLKCNARTWK